jgi:hypothetical protein
MHTKRQRSSPFHLSNHRCLWFHWNSLPRALCREGESEISSARSTMEEVSECAPVKCYFTADQVFQVAYRTQHYIYTYTLVAEREFLCSWKYQEHDRNQLSSLLILLTIFGFKLHSHFSCTNACVRSIANWLDTFKLRQPKTKGAIKISLEIIHKSALRKTGSILWIIDSVESFSVTSYVLS